MTHATMMSPAPQHLRALERANAVRLARAELKRRVAAGDVAVAEIVLSCPWEAESMTIADLLLSQRRWGHTRCRRFLQAIPLTESKTIGSLTDRQRRAVAQQLEQGSARPAEAMAEARPFAGAVA